MTGRTLLVAFIIAIAVLPVSAQLPTPKDSVTLYSVLGSKGDGVIDSFSFLRGVTGASNRYHKYDFELLYGSARLSERWDWFDLGSMGRDRRNVIADLGAKDWIDVTAIPTLCPRARLNPGEQRSFTFDASADAKTVSPEQFLLPAIEGHMYLMRIYDDSTDQYVLFRVDAIERGESCRLSWRLMPHPLVADKDCCID